MEEEDQLTELGTKRTERVLDTIVNYSQQKIPLVEEEEKVRVWYPHEVRGGDAFMNETEQGKMVIVLPDTHHCDLCEKTYKDHLDRLAFLSERNPFRRNEDLTYNSRECRKCKPRTVFSYQVCPECMSLLIGRLSKPCVDMALGAIDSYQKGKKRQREEKI
jgi:hypothetical protein